MWFRKKEDRNLIELQSILLGSNTNVEVITKEIALNIPTVAACVELISSTVASLPIYLYKDNANGVERVKNDYRENLLNDITGDSLDGFQFKKALLRDYLLNGGGYAYIKRKRNQIESLHYVEFKDISIVPVTNDPIFKEYDMIVNGEYYRPYDFVKLLRNTANGVEGSGILQENKEILSTTYNSLVFEKMLVKSGGNKKGFLKAASKLSEDAITDLKAKWKSLYSNNENNVMVLNAGLEFQESSNDSVEMQLNQNKESNVDSICSILNVNPSIIKGKCSEEEYFNFIKVVILPILKALETVLNRELLLSDERGSFYFACDTKELLKGDIEKRFRAYELATKNGILQVDEIRYLEDFKPLGLDFIKLGLQDVLYDPKTKQIYTPNTNKSTTINNPDDTLKGGENDED